LNFYISLKNQFLSIVHLHQFTSFIIFQITLFY